MAFIGGTFYLSFFLCFIDNFINEKMPKKWLLFLYIFPSVISSLFAFSKYAIAETFFIPGMPTQNVPGILYTIYSFLYLAVIIYGGVLLFNAYKKSSTQKRKQILYVGLGFTLLSLGSIIFNFILPFLGELRFFSLGTQFSIFFILFSAYAILKHNLLDIKIVIQRSIIYTTLLAMIIGFYLAILFISSTIFGYITNKHLITICVITTVIAILTVPKIERFFKKITDKIFFKDNYNYSIALRELSNILGKQIELKTILNESCKKLKQILKAQDVCFILLPQNLIFDTKEQLKPIDNKICSNKIITDLINERKIIVDSEINETSNKEDETYKKYQQAHSKIKQLCLKKDLEITAPLITEDKIIGLLTLGKKQSGDLYTKEDITLLETFSCQAAMALKKTELYEEVKDYSKNLEKKVEERVSEVKKLQDKQTQIVLDISHALQTPLTIAKGELAILKQKMPNVTAFNSFEKTIDHLSRFISGILQLAKLDFISDDYKKETVNLSGLMADLLEYFAVLVEPKKITIIPEIKAGIFVPGKRDKLQEVIINLVSNAIKYIANDKKIFITLEDTESKARIIIKDTGIGIPEVEIPYLFKRFYRVKSQENNTEGTGLGLAICEKIVNNHNGAITITSELNKGTTVTVNLPKKVE